MGGWWKGGGGWRFLSDSNGIVNWPIGASYADVEDGGRDQREEPVAPICPGGWVLLLLLHPLTLMEREREGVGGWGVGRVARALLPIDNDIVGILVTCCDPAFDNTWGLNPRRPFLSSSSPCFYLSRLRMAANSDGGRVGVGGGGGGQGRFYFFVGISEASLVASLDCDTQWSVM